MSTISVVLIVVAIVGLVVVAMAVQSLITTLRSLRTTVEDLREETMSAVAELRATVALANGAQFFDFGFKFSNGFFEIEIRAHDSGRRMPGRPAERGNWRFALTKSR